MYVWTLEGCNHVLCRGHAMRMLGGLLKGGWAREYTARRLVILRAAL
jgi:hypothetical protein